jgi:hypothetical protein
MATYESFDAVREMQRDRFEQVMDAFITDILVTVRARTPKDTGTSRSGWDRFPPGLSEPGMRQEVSNEVPYIVVLEYGHSKQAPNGMARITAEESQQRMDAAVALVVGA